MRKFYLETYGCKFNFADSEIISGILKRKYKKSILKSADFVVINSCGLIKRTEFKILKRIKELKKRGKKIILGGCLPLISLKNFKKLVEGMIGPQNLNDILKVAQKVVEGKKIYLLKEKKFDKSKCFLLKERNSNISALVQISEGCLSNCSYCITRFARGKLKSFPLKNILNEVKRLVKKGFKEINLTSQDLAIYGLDKRKFLLPKLLKEIIKIEGSFRMRLGMMNPRYLPNILEELISLYQSEKIYKFIHLPVQSGSDKVLKEMRRGYKVKDFLKIVEKFRKKFKDFLLATDFIVGFPTEKEKDFQKTIKLLERIKPTICHIFRYSERRASYSSKFKDLAGKIKKERSRTLYKIWKKINLKENSRFLNREFICLAVEKRRKNTFLLRTPSFRAVILKEPLSLGKFERVKIVDFKENYLLGKKVKRGEGIDLFQKEITFQESHELF